MECVICWKNIFCDFSEGSRIADRRHVNTTENEVSPTDIFISNWFDICQWSNISKTMLWNGLLVLLVLMAGFPWNMARPPLRLLSLTVKFSDVEPRNFTLRSPKTSNKRCTPILTFSQTNFQNKSILWDGPYIKELTVSINNSIYIDTLLSIINILIIDIQFLYPLVTLVMWYFRRYSGQDRLFWSCWNCFVVAFLLQGVCIEFNCRSIEAHSCCWAPTQKCTFGAAWS